MSNNYNSPLCDFFIFEGRVKKNVFPQTTTDRMCQTANNFLHKINFLFKFVMILIMTAYNATTFPRNSEKTSFYLTNVLRTVLTLRIASSTNTTTNLLCSHCFKSQYPQKYCTYTNSLTLLNFNMSKHGMIECVMKLSRMTSESRWSLLVFLMPACFADANLFLFHYLGKLNDQFAGCCLCAINRLRVKLAHVGFIIIYIFSLD